MIKVETVETTESGIKVEMKGTVMDLMADTVQIVDALAIAISEKSEISEEIIRETILYGITDCWRKKRRRIMIEFQKLWCAYRRCNNCGVEEEVKEINNKDIKVSKQPVFTKEIEIRELNPYEQNSTLKMRADFYTVEIAKDINLKPNDLPALIEIPKEKFYDIKLASNLSMKYIKDYIIKNEEEISIPENYAIMAPKEVKNFLV